MAPLPRTRRLSDVLSPDSNSFGVVRLLAALAVVVSHDFGVRAGGMYADPFDAWTGFSLGKHAVHVFFVLSGLLVTMSLARSASLYHYAQARFLRIYPGFTACVLFTVLVLGPLVTTVSLREYLLSPQVFRYVVETLGLVTAKQTLPGVFAGNPMAGEVNLSLWTLKHEVFCYVLLASFAATSLLTTRRRSAMVLGGLCILLAASYGRPDWIIEESLLDSLRRFIICFSLGSLAYTFREEIRLSPMVLLAACVIGSLALGTFLAVPVMLLLTAYGTLIVAGQRFGLLSRWTEKNDLSFGVYLYGWPVAQTVLVFWPQAGIWELHAITIVASVALAVASWRLVEQPALELRKRKSQGRALAPLPQSAVG